MEPIIKVENLSKKYLLGVLGHAEDSFREALIRGLRKPWDRVRGHAAKAKTSSGPSSIWALRDLNFEIYPGDTVGIIGSNGAGKSTLLKILARITDPTEGVARLRGRTGCLLEVGTGFHPELTGRENVYLNGAILGMNKAEIDSKFDEIVAFAEIDKFLDTPVKHFSSGMYLRLAFSVAAHLDPEILIVDEALAVGDMAFQKKCLAKMRDFSRSGRTVLFVSHSLAALENLCSKGIVLTQGQLVFSGSASDAIKHYVAGPSECHAATASCGFDLTRAPGRSSRYRPFLKHLELLDRDGHALQQGLQVGETLKVHVLFDLIEPTSIFGVTLAFDNLFGQRILVVSSNYQPDRSHEEHFGERGYVCELPNFTLVPGEYRIQATMSVGGGIVDRVEDAARLTVIGSDFYGTGRMPTEGTCVLEQDWQLKKPAAPESDRFSNVSQPSIASFRGQGT